MQCYTELLPPTAVTHSVSLPFLGPKSNNLLVAKTSLLQIFTLQHKRDGQGSGLSLVGEYPLAGTVTAIKSVKLSTTRTGGDAVLIAFKDAKLSLLEWDPENHRIGTISIHYYEGENITLQPFGPTPAECDSILTVDPSSRCAALKFGPRHVAIIPFRHAADDIGGDIEGGFDVEMDNQPLTTTASQSAEKSQSTPYKPSFVLALTALDPGLTHPIDLALLYEYREPTFGILSSSVQPSVSLLEERKECLTYTVFTLDLEQRASTNLISVTKLPSSLWKLIPLQLPVGGALLLGTNEVLHIDQSGRVNGVGVNEFAAKSAVYTLSDQCDLSLELEDCQVQLLDSRNGDLLLILNNGSFAILRFHLTGRDVSGLEVTKVDEGRGGQIMASLPSTVALLRDRLLFVGSDDGDSALLAWHTESATMSRKRSHAQMLDEDISADESDEMEEVDDDDLYAPAADTAKTTMTKSSDAAKESVLSYSFVHNETLPSLGPINNVCFGKSRDDGKMETLVGTGRGRASRLALVSRELVPAVEQRTDLTGVVNAWALRTQPENETDVSEGWDNSLFVYDGESTKAYTIQQQELEEGGVRDDEPSPSHYVERTGTDFESEGETLAISTLMNGRRVVHCRRHEIRTYDAELGLSGILPMINEETDEELNIVATSFCDPYVLVLRHDSSVQILQVDKAGDIEPLEIDGIAKKRKWLSGCLYSGTITDEKASAFLLGEDGALCVFSLPDMQQQYTALAVPHLPAVLYGDAAQRRTGVRETIVELLIADLGTADIHRSYMIVRTALDDLVLYEPFHFSNAGSKKRDFSNLRWRKVTNTYIPRYDESINGGDSARPAVLKPLRLGNHKTVYIPGRSPTLILKEPTSLPKMIGMKAQGVKAVTSLNVESCSHGYLLIDQEPHVRECCMPPNAWYGTGWSVRSTAICQTPQEVRQIAYHDERNVYVVATCQDVPFQWPTDDGKHHDHEDISLRPRVPQYHLHIMLAANQEVIATLNMPPLETITAMKILQLEVSEHSRAQKQVLVVASALQQGEDKPAKGAISVFELIDVVPIVARPETGIRLKAIAREEVRGAVTAIEGFPGGFLGTVQGQKLMVRGLKEDGSCLPVAFLDALCNMTTLKTFVRSGMWLAGDSWKGLWFGGFIEEPYRLSVLGKSRTHLEVVTAEFLPFNEQLFILLVDADTNLHVLQYDPENPKSLSGTRLLHRGSFHLGHFPSSMTLLPSTLAPFSEQGLANGESEEDSKSPALFHVLTTSQTGSVGLVTPVDETTYRRLSALQTHLTSILEHAAGLNPRAYRAAETDGAGTRQGIIDGSLIQRISELGASRRAEVVGRAGGDVWGLRSDLEIIGGGGLTYL